MIVPRWVPRLTVALAAVCVLGCASAKYYQQAIVGGARVAFGARSIHRLLEDPATPSELRERLERVVAIRRFAIDELGLPDSKSYRRYKTIDREFVAWNVVAAPRWSTEPRRWCFPIAGCVAYRGYFDRSAAERFARSLAAQGDDVAVFGVAAYSTLGWLADPVLSTTLAGTDTDLAALVFHELAHEILYVRGDSEFNESFATAVEIEGVTRWLAAVEGPGEVAAYELAVRHDAEFSALVQQLKQRLESLYTTELGANESIELKERAFQEFRATYDRIQEGWAGDTRYDDWVTQSLNNAHLAAWGTYHRWLPAFRRLVSESEGDLPLFYQRVGELGELPAEAREERLVSLLRPEDREVRSEPSISGQDEVRSSGVAR